MYLKRGWNTEKKVLPEKEVHEICKLQQRLDRQFYPKLKKRVDKKKLKLSFVCVVNYGYENTNQHILLIWWFLVFIRKFESWN